MSLLTGFWAWRNYITKAVICQENSIILFIRGLGDDRGIALDRLKHEVCSCGLDSRNALDLAVELFKAVGGVREYFEHKIVFTREIVTGLNAFGISYHFGKNVVVFGMLKADLHKSDKVVAELLLVKRYRISFDRVVCFKLFYSLNDRRNRKIYFFADIGCLHSRIFFKAGEYFEIYLIHKSCSF